MPSYSSSSYPSSLDSFYSSAPIPPSSHSALDKDSTYYRHRPRRHRHNHLSSQDEHTRSTFSASSTHRKRSTIPSLQKKPPHSSSPSVPGPTKPAILPGKRGKLTRLILVAVILFPPVAIFLLAMLPMILLVTVVFTYSIAWLLYWIMAGPLKFSALPLDPRRVWKLNKIVFSVVFSNLSLIPIGVSLLQYRYWTMRGSPDFFPDIHYNSKRPANKLDVYLPQEPTSVTASKLYRRNTESEGDVKLLKPVVVFIYGGAWSSGSKWMYTLVGARLRSMGYVVIVPNYSIYPDGKIKDMEQDVKMAIQWAHKNCEDFGGDPNRLYIMGHSAGAHLCALTVLNDSIQRIPVSLFGSFPAAISASPILASLLSEPRQKEDKDVLPRLRGMILCSGVYDIGEHYKHETMRGVEEISAMARVMGNSEATFRMHSPTNILQELLQVSTRIDRNYPTESQTRHQHLLRHLKSLLPVETLMIHGDLDRTVPVKSSLEFFMELKTLQMGSGVRYRLMQGMAHEEPVVALMPCSIRKAPFMQPLMDEISQFIVNEKLLPN